MFEIKCVPLITPSPNYKAFAAVLGQQVVSEVDSKQVRPVAKTATLVNFLLSGTEAIQVNDHLFVSVYFEVPSIAINYWLNYADFKNLRVKSKTEGLVTKGILTGSLDDLVSFAESLGDSEIEWESKFGGMLIQCLKSNL